MPARQRDVVDAVSRLDTLRGAWADDPEIAARLSQYELAFQMQASVPDLVDLSDESQSTFDLYGTKGATDPSLPTVCWPAGWPSAVFASFSSTIATGTTTAASRRTCKALRPRSTVARGAVEDLARRGMLDETLVVFGTEFGRTPMAQGDGRDHHMKAFSIWLAGGGIKGA